MSSSWRPSFIEPLTLVRTLFASFHVRNTFIEFPAMKVFLTCLSISTILFVKQMEIIRGALLLLTLNLITCVLINGVCDSVSKESGDRDRCVVKCEWGDHVCECPPGFEECEFNMDVDEIKSFVSYQILRNNERKQLRGSHGTIYNLDSVTGEPVAVRMGRTCSNYTDNSTVQCTEPNWVDGINFKVMIAINGVVPSPTIIVDEGATIIVHVNNQLLAEATSIHWHGIEQHNTPWMDGVGEITQCGIRAGTTFTYAFVAAIPGTFWYHSHTGTQRADGMFGALVIRENSETVSRVLEHLEGLGIGSYEDFPDRHTLVLSDWFRGTGIDDISQLNAGLGFFPDEPIDEVPMRGDGLYSSTHTYDQSEVGPTPFFSSLINGLGREESVPYTRSRLSVFRVTKGETYRFRLIGAQALYALRFSIDGHNLTTIATDSYFIKPIEEVTYIILHSGERYDFLLNASADIGSYIIRIETLEVVKADCNAVPPFHSLNHSSEAILQYETGAWSIIPSTAYHGISQSSPRRECTMWSRCKAVNCPFKNFHNSYGIDCINVGDFQLLLRTPDDKLPGAYATKADHLFFFNLNFEGESFTSAINGRNFLLPPYPPLTQNQEFESNAKICNRSVNCSITNTDCLCTQIVRINYNETVQFVVSAVGQFLNAHPLHLHGHTFHVVKIGYPSYYGDNNVVNTVNSDIVCDDPTRENDTDNGVSDCSNSRSKCTAPSWRTATGPELSMNATTPRKDTLIIPAGGYIVINFISDNPGTWFMHCHIEPHQLEGMALVVEEAKSRHNPPPRALATCGNFVFNSTEFYEKVSFVPGSYATVNLSSLTLLLAMSIMLLCL